MISPGLEVINRSGLMAAWLDLSISPYLVAISKLALLMSAFVTFVKSLETVNTLFAERESHATFFLQEQEVTRYDVVNFISHGITKVDNFAYGGSFDNSSSQNNNKAATNSPLETYCVNLNKKAEQNKIDRLIGRAKNFSANIFILFEMPYFQLLSRR